MVKCILCGDEIKVEPSGWDQGNNAEPLAKGRCCNTCNEKVIGARIQAIVRQRK